MEITRRPRGIAVAGSKRGDMWRLEPNLLGPLVWQSPQYLRTATVDHAVMLEVALTEICRVSWRSPPMLRYAVVQKHRRSDPGE
jgi:hypothetical protein